MLTESSATRPLRLRLRPDLEIRDSSSSAEKIWIIRDPVTLRYFRLNREEHELLNGLDGSRSLVDIQRHYNALFSPLHLEMQQLMAFLSRLYAEGLLVSDAPAQAIPLQIRRKKNRFHRSLALWSNPLAIRGPGVSPGPILDRVTACLGGLFTFAGFLLSLILFSTALSLVITHRESVNARLPQMQSFFEGKNFLLLLAVLAIVKVFHELGHAASCRKFGGRCHQIGVMFLMCVPTLFCDVSDAWLIPQRMKRVIISAAGMYVEMILASVATILWWNSSPGIFNAVCLNVMLVCSISTVLINGNPFLRYDGYYILSDLVNIPNLKQRSSSWWKMTLKSVCLGLKSSRQELPSSKRHTFLFCVYGFASTVFRLCLLTMILWFVYQFLEQHKLAVFFPPLLLIVLSGTLGPPLKRTGQLLSDPLARAQMRPFRMASTIFGGLLLALFCGFVPLPTYVYCPALIEPYEAQHVYAYYPGRLKSSIAENSTVSSGDLIYELENDTLEYELEELSGQLEVQKTHLRSLEQRSSESVEIQNQIPLAQKFLKDLQQQYQQRLDQKSQLTGFASMDGIVYPPPISHQPSETSLELSYYTGSPFNPQNSGCQIEAGTLLCTIGLPEKMQATLLADEQTLQLIKQDQQASLLPTASTLGVIDGHVSAIGRTRQETVPDQFLPDESIVIVPRVDGTSAPVNPLWEVRVRWTESTQDLPPGMRGTARIRVDSMTLLTRFRRWVNATFRT